MTTDNAQFGKYLKLVGENPKKKRALYVGDSWFQYPLRGHADLQTRIDTKFRNELLGLDDSYPGRDADETSGLIGRWRGFAADLQDIGKPFDLICVSLGGNDVIGKDFVQHLFKVPTEQPEFNWPWSQTIPEIVRTRIKINSLNQAFKTVAAAYRLIFKLRNELAPKATILGHTYADITPSNAPYKFFGIKTGPWIWQPLINVGVKDRDAQREISRWLLLSFANLLKALAKETERFVVLDSRLELADLDGWWDNEIHPLGNGFKLLAEKYWFPAVDRALNS